jgi:hypothetical protein
MNKETNTQQEPQKLLSPKGAIDCSERNSA